MTPRLRNLSGRQVVRVLAAHGFVLVGTRGSHAKLRRLVTGSAPQVLTVPLHKALAPGTLHAIYRQACRYIPEHVLREDFFSP